MLFKNLNLFVCWPALTLLTLQIGLSLCLENESWIFYALFLGLFSLLLLISINNRSTLRFLILASIVFLSLCLHLIEKKDLSVNLFFKKARYVATICDVTVLSEEGYSKVIVDLEQRLFPLPDKVTGRIVLTVGEICELPIDATVEFLSKVSLPSAYKNPGVFDYRAHLRRQNIWGKAFLNRCDEIQVLSVKQPSFFTKLHERIYDQIDSKNGPILSALLLGTRTVGRDKKEIIKEAGLMHLFAISGTHFGVMGMLVYCLVSFFTSLYPKIYLYCSKQKIASGFTLLFIWFYMMLLPMHASIFRSGIMMTVFLLAIIIERQKNILAVILASAAVLLFFKPLDLFEAGCQLSYLCVLILAIVYPFWQTKIKTTKFFINRSRPVKYLLDIIVMSLVIHLCLMPILLFDFGMVSLAGWINNVWAVPYFTFVVIPLSLAYFIFAAFGLPDLSVVLTLWDRSIDVFFACVHWVGCLPLPKFESFAPHLLHLLVFYFFLFAFFLTKKRIHLILMCVLLTLSFFKTYYDTHLGFDLRITQIDVGHGDAIFIQTKNRNMLIDTGGNQYFDIGQQVLAPFFKFVWVRTLDVVAITHSDLDHHGGLLSLLDEMKIKEIWINDLPTDDSEYQKLLEKIEAQKIPLRIMTHHEKISFDPETEWNVLSPTPEFSSLTNDNDHSIVMQLEQGEFKALFTGDISKKAEKILVKVYGHELKSNLLKLAHHGSPSSSGRLFLKMVSPEIVMIGVSDSGRFGHPNGKLVQNLKNGGAQVWRTDVDGAVQLNVTGGRVTVTKCPAY